MTETELETTTLDRETILEEEIEDYLESRRERETSRLGIRDDESLNRRGQLLSSVATRERVFCLSV